MASVPIPDDVRDPLVEPRPAGLTRSGVARLDAIDMLRGLVIALMVLDHVRDFFHVSAQAFDATNALKSYPALFATRWITHLCATTFVFLAGVSILFQKANGKPPAALSRFLLTRGLWLVFLEVTLISFGFNFGPVFLFLQVIWAIGVSMVLMSLVSRLPSPAVLAIGAAILLLYPLVVPLTAGAEGALDVARRLAFVPTLFADAQIFAVYPVLPWFGVMCLGFGLGPVFRMEAARRDRILLILALGLLFAFAVLRTLNGYGDPSSWKQLSTPAQTAMSFLALSKYPPSPDFVAATLGLSMLLFLALARLRGPVARVLLDFGRTPLFTYVAHLYIAHLLMLIVGAAMGRPDAAIGYLTDSFAGDAPNGWGFSLPIVYLIWLAVLALLVPLSRWFAGVKRRRRDWWLGYL